MVVFHELTEMWIWKHHCDFYLIERQTRCEFHTNVASSNNNCFTSLVGANCFHKFVRITHIPKIVDASSIRSSCFKVCKVDDLPQKLKVWWVVKPLQSDTSRAVPLKIFHIWKNKAPPYTLNLELRAQMCSFGELDTWFDKLLSKAKTIESFTIPQWFMCLLNDLWSLMRGPENKSFNSRHS